MAEPLGLKERVGLIAVACVALFSLGYMGVKALRQPPKIVMTTDAAALDAMKSPPLTGPGAKQPDVAPQGGPGSSPKLEIDTSAREVVVHVLGEVKKPGVVRLPNGSRVNDAIEAAGGQTAAADLNQLNLAARLEDGTQLLVPSKTAPSSSPSSKQVPPKGAPKESGPPKKAPAIHPSYKSNSDSSLYTDSGPPKTATNDPDTHSASSKSSAGALAPGSISLNSASAEELDKLPGVGPATAKNILDYRKARGGFTSLDQLLEVKGIGPKKYDQIRPYVRL